MNEWTNSGNNEPCPDAKGEKNQDTNFNISGSYGGSNSDRKSGKEDHNEKSKDQKEAQRHKG